MHNAVLLITIFGPVKFNTIEEAFLSQLLSFKNEIYKDKKHFMEVIDVEKASSFISRFKLNTLNFSSLYDALYTTARTEQEIMLLFTKDDIKKSRDLLRPVVKPRGCYLYKKYTDDDIIKVIDVNNPIMKKHLYVMYKDNMTVREFYESGGKREHLQWHANPKKNIIEIVKSQQEMFNE